MNLQPEHLSAIRAIAMTGARSIRAEGNECQAILLLFALRPDNQLGACSVLNVEQADKDTRASLQQRAARSPAIAAAVLINEGWQAVLTPGEEIPDTVSDRPDRQEVLLINVLSAADQWMLVAEIHDNRIDDAEFIKVENGNLSGRFIREPARV